MLLPNADWPQRPLPDFARVLVAAVLAENARVMGELYGPDYTWNPGVTAVECVRRLGIRGFELNPYRCNDSGDMFRPNLAFGAVIICWRKTLNGSPVTNVTWSDREWSEWAAGLTGLIRSESPTYDGAASHDEYRRGWADAVAAAENPSTYLGYPQPTGLQWGPDDVVVDGDWLAANLHTLSVLAGALLEINGAGDNLEYVRAKLGTFDLTELAVLRDVHAPETR